MGRPIFDGISRHALDTDTMNSPNTESAVDLGDISVFVIGSFVIRHRLRILVWMVISVAVAAVPLLLEEPKYTARGSFVLGAGESERSGVSALAGQFGLVLPTSSALQSPQFYADLVQTREFLLPLVGDTIPVSNRRTTLAELFELPVERRSEVAVAALRDMVGATVARQTGVIAVSATTPWPDASVAIVRRLMQRVNEFNLQTRQAQAGAERRFSEERLAGARESLRRAEDRLKDFLQANRQIGDSPQLSFERDRLERDVALHQQIYTSLANAGEEIRIRELRNTPAITVIESPWVSDLPDSTRRRTRILFGLIIGAALGVTFSLLSAMMTQRRTVGDPHVRDFYAQLGELRASIFFWKRQWRIGSHG